jgi:peptidylprolyl isomerase
VKDEGRGIVMRRMPSIPSNARMIAVLVFVLALGGCGVAAPPEATAEPTPIEATAVTTGDGLQYIELVPGNSDHPQPGDVVEVHYRGMLEDGTQFDSSYQRGAPTQFVLGAGAVLPGWDEGVALMRKGGKARLILPPGLAYGEKGGGGIIPPNATLTYDMELVEIRRNPPAAPAQVEEAQYTTTPGGLKYYDRYVGTGAEAVAGSTVAVHYTGWLADGTRVNTSLLPGRPMARQRPFELTLGQAPLKGWDEGIAGMRVGGMRQLVVPPELAYGDQGAGDGAIPPGATIVFEIELIEVK